MPTACRIAQPETRHRDSDDRLGRHWSLTTRSAEREKTALVISDSSLATVPNTFAVRQVLLRRVPTVLSARIGILNELPQLGEFIGASEPNESG